MNQLIERFENNFTELELSETSRYYYLVQVFEESNFEALDNYLSKGFSLNPRNEYLSTPAFRISESDIDFIEYAVEKGLDLNVIDINGQTILFNLSISAKKEIFAYALSKGMNPYERDFEGITLFAFKDFFKGDLTEEFIKENSIYSEKEFTYEQALLDKNFPLALSIFEKTIQRMGGLEKLTIHLKDQMNVLDKQPKAHFVLKRLYNVYLLNQRYEEANSVLKFYLHVMQDVEGITPDSRCSSIGLAAPLILNDIDTAHSIAKINYASTDYLERSFSAAYASFVSKQMSGDTKTEFKTEFHRIGHFALTKMGLESLFTEINTPMLMRTVPLRNDFTNDIEPKLSELDKVSQLDYLFCMGLVFLHNKEKEQAEYYFVRVINLSEELGCIHDNLMAQSYAMIDYLRR